MHNKYTKAYQRKPTRCTKSASKVYKENIQNEWREGVFIVNSEDLSCQDKFILSVV